MPIPSKKTKNNSLIYSSIYLTDKLYQFVDFFGRVLIFIPEALKQHVRKILDNDSTVTRFTTSVTYPVEI
jgi:hypothetical protein